MSDLLQRQTEALAKGMSHSLWAELKGDEIAIFDPLGRTTFRHINEAANKIVRLLRERGLKEGDAVALLCSNRAAFVEVLAGCLRNATAVARWLQDHGFGTSDRPVTVIAAGERETAIDEIRPAVRAS